MNRREFSAMLGAGLAVHTLPDQLTLPLGVKATLDAGKGTIAIEESAVD